MGYVVPNQASADILCAPVPLPCGRPCSRPGDRGQEPMSGSLTAVGF